MLGRVTTAGALTAVCLCGSAFARLAPAPPILVATLNATNQAGPNKIFGNVKLTPSSDGEYRVDMSIRNGGGAQNKYPWIIRSGQCGESAGTELGNPVAYRMLETTGDGTARIVNAKMKLEIPEGVHHVDVLKSPTEREVVVACGVLSPQQ